jgi:glycosyltransferase involved in cell wall biosynthesis
MRAAVRVKEQVGSNVLFVVAGSGSLETELKALAEQLGIDDCFKFVGRIDDMDMPNFLNAIDVLALTSPFEGLGVIILEAMAVGKPVVTTDSGGVRDSVTDGQTGVIVPVGDDVNLANAILKLANDRKLAERMGRAGMLRARQDFTLEKYTQAYWHLFTS